MRSAVHYNIYIVQGNVMPLGADSEINETKCGESMAFATGLIVNLLFIFSILVTLANHFENVNLPDHIRLGYKLFHAVGPLV
jgi:hypothetical protein